jgi:hypothetical protein
MVRSVCLLAILALGAAPGFAQSGPFIEQNGIVVVEIESTPVVGQWVSETIWPDYTGTAYYRYNGANQFNNPGVAKLGYQLAIEHAGEYRLAIRNRHEDPNPELENDVWVRMDGGPWIKCFSNDGPGSVGAWNWATNFEIEGVWKLPLFELTHGIHLFEISARSRNYQIDRFVLSQSYVNNPTWKGRPESPIYTGQSNIQNYCTAKLNSSGCLASMSSSGVPQKTGSFIVSATGLLNNKSAMMIYGFGQQAAPFQGGTLCILPPIKRLPVQITPAGPTCTGQISVDFATVNDGNLGAGITTYVQCWYRDGKDPFGSGLTDGLQFTWVL